jgi:hypothetical protein
LKQEALLGLLIGLRLKRKRGTGSFDSTPRFVLQSFFRYVSIVRKLLASATLQSFGATVLLETMILEMKLSCVLPTIRHFGSMGYAMRFLKVTLRHESLLDRAKTGLILSMVATALSACGGGSNSPSAVSPDPQGGGVPASITISGTVAKGMAFSGASVVATNPLGTVGSPVAVAVDGSYSLTVPSDVQFPIVLTASKPLPTGEIESFSSVIADKANNLANITPITNVIAALLSSNGNPDRLAAQVAGGMQITQATLNAKTLAVQNVLKPVTDTLGLASVDPIRGGFVANGAGYDRLLDSVNVSVTPIGSASNIEIGLRIKSASELAQPLVSQFVSSQATLPTLPSVDAGTFIANGTSAKLARLMADLQGCYALPLSTRISKAAATATEVTGTAADISAAQCREVFLGNSPANYKNSGNTVGRDSVGAGAFAGFFVSSSTGAKFDNAEYEYTLPNGDIGFSFRTSVSGGTPTIFVNIARLDPADQRLKFVGDQYSYNGKVFAVMEKRVFPVANQLQWNYLSTGYILNVDNTAQFSKVEVTAPTGSVYTLVPSNAAGFLSYSTRGSTNFVRLRSEFEDTTKTIPVPTKLTSEISVVAFESPDLSDLAIAALPNQSVWAFRYFLKGNTGTTPDVVQVYRTRARALSIAELRNRTLPTVSAQVVSSWAVSAIPITGNIGLKANAPFDVAWSVPASALPPVSATLFGRYPTVTATSFATFTDSASIGAGPSTSIAIPCRPLVPVVDIHCDGATNGGFKAGSEATGVNLVGIDYLGRNIGTHYAFNLLTVAP